MVASSDRHDQEAADGAWKIVGRRTCKVRPAATQQGPRTEQRARQGTLRGGGKAGDSQGRWQAWPVCFSLQVQRTECGRKGSARRASEESKTCLLTGADTEEADCTHQGHAGVATTPPSCPCGGAGTQVQGTPCERPKGASPWTGQESCGQDGAAGQDSPRGVSQARSAPGRIGDDVSGGPTPDSDALLGMLAFTKAQAEGGNNEAQAIHKQMDGALPGSGTSARELRRLRLAREYRQRSEWHRRCVHEGRGWTPTKSPLDAADGDPEDRRHPSCSGAARRTARICQRVKRRSPGHQYYGDVHASQSQGKDPAGQPGFWLIRCS
eukprot:2998666-Amphidinium_carterae.1